MRANYDQLAPYIDGVWDASIVAALSDYIRIPNKSQLFDPQWQEHGHMLRAVQLVEDWCRARAIAGLTVERVQLPGCTPLLFMEIPGAADSRGETVLLYGHLDKQPELGGWREGLSPWQPVLEGDRLYGRGGADDGYAAFASLAAIEALQKAGIPHARCVVLIEAGEESGSPDLPAYIAHLHERIGDVSFVVCLDSGCGDYERLWSTTSLRGLVTGNLVVDVLDEAVHSGDASGIVASSFRIVRSLLSRIEDERTGKLKLRELHAPVPKGRVAEAKATARVLGRRVFTTFPWVKGMRPMHKDVTELILNRTFRPTLSVTGVAGIPAMQDAGNVLRPRTALKLSIRVPPTCDADRATKAVTRALEREKPYGAQVRFESEKASAGWNAPALAPWLGASLSASSRACFGKDACFMGEGGSIPFMAMLGASYPKAQFLITGVLGPQSNAHGPNEFLHLPTAKRLTACVARAIADHHLALNAARDDHAREVKRGHASATKTSRRRVGSRRRHRS